VKNLKTQEDLLVETFLAEIEVQEEMQAGEICATTVARWQQLEICGYSSEQLLESVHRHVKGLTDAEINGELGVFDHHLQMLNLVADELERRLQGSEAEH
jgi:hypothetical protein